MVRSMIGQGVLGMHSEAFIKIDDIKEKLSKLEALYQWDVSVGNTVIQDFFDAE